MSNTSYPFYLRSVYQGGMVYLSLLLILTLSLFIVGFEFALWLQNNAKIQVYLLEHKQAFWHQVSYQDCQNILMKDFNDVFQRSKELNQIEKASLQFDRNRYNQSSFNQVTIENHLGLDMSNWIKQTCQLAVKF